MSLKDLSVSELRAASVDLEHQIRALRDRRLAIARELERRLPEPQSESRVVPQVMEPAFVESEATVPSLDEPPRRRWRKR